MTCEDMNEYMRTVIAPAKAMDIRLTRWEPGRVEVTAPLEANSNHAGTGFGGSIGSLLLLAGWASVKVMLPEDLSGAHIVVKTSRVDYLRPVTGELTASVSWPDDRAVADMIAELRDLQRAELPLKTLLVSNGKTCAESNADFVIRLKGRKR